MSFRNTAPRLARLTLSIVAPVLALKARTASMSATHSVSAHSASPFGAFKVTPLLPPASQAAPAAARTVHRTVSRMGAPPPRCPASRRLRLLHLLLPRLDHLVRHFRRHLLIHMRL